MGIEVGAEDLVENERNAEALSLMDIDQLIENYDNSKLIFLLHIS